MTRPSPLTSFLCLLLVCLSSLPVRSAGHPSAHRHPFAATARHVHSKDVQSSAPARHVGERTPISSSEHEFASPRSAPALSSDRLRQSLQQLLELPFFDAGDVIDLHPRPAKAGADLNSRGKRSDDGDEMQERQYGRPNSWSPRDTGNADIEAKLSALQSALDSLTQALEQDYGVSTPAASQGQWPASSTSTSTATAGTASTTVSATAISLPSEPASAQNYTFNPLSRSNNAVYYSQTTATSSTPLTSLCADPNIDIVILAFLNDLTNPAPTNANSSSIATAGYPTLNLGPNCWAASAAQQAAGAGTLIDCVGDGFYEQIEACQGTYGKKVMLSLGGAQGYSETTLASADVAQAVAQNVWDLFLGGGTDEGTLAIRPFGSVVLDGVDIDNESGTTVNIDVLMSSLRQLFTTDSSHTYYLSAAPQCPQPDASIPLASMQTQTDFIWVQFYNNPQCNLNSGAGFASSLQTWSESLMNASASFVDIGNGVTAPMLYIGAPAFPAAGSGFVEDGEQLRSILEGVKGLGLPNLGGVMWWDGSFELQSAQYDSNAETFAQIVKDVFS